MKTVRCNHMTLVEVMVAMGFLSMLLLFTLMFLTSITDAAGVHQDISDLDRQSETAFNRISIELQSGYIPYGAGTVGVTAEDWTAGLDAGAASIDFLTPVDWDNDGDELNAALEPEFGIVRSEFTPGHFLYEGAGQGGNDFYATVRFVQTGTCQEANIRTDLNRNGNSTDSFQLGYLEMVYPAATCTVAGAVHQDEVLQERLVRLTPDIVLQGDLDPSDVANEPLFQLTASTLTIDLFTCDTTEKSPVLRRMTTAIQIRNMQ